MSELVIKTALENGDLKMTKYFTKKELMRVNNKSIEANRNRTLEPSYLEKLDEKLLFPIVFELPHNDVEMRTRIQLSDTDNGFLDMDFKDYDKLPTWKGGG
jgi:hypothetical protein